MDYPGYKSQTIDDVGHNTFNTRKQCVASSSFNNNHSAPTVGQVIGPREMASSSQQVLPGKAVEACDEVELIKNISDILSPKEVEHLLFDGHENEDIALKLLNPEIGSQTFQENNNDDPPIHLSFVDDLQTTSLKMFCLFCYRNMIYDTYTCCQRPCGHYFHIHCFHSLPPSVQGQHMKNNECYFCILKRPKNSI